MLLSYRESRNGPQISQINTNLMMRALRTVHFAVQVFANLCVLCVSCGIRLNIHNRRDAEDTEAAQRLETEPGPDPFICVYLRKSAADFC